MIILPDVKPYERPLTPAPPNLDTFPIYATLNKGMKLFREEDFSLLLPKEGHRDYTKLHMSSIGHCGRKEWYHLYDTEKYDALEANLRRRIPPPYVAWHFGHIVEAYTLHLLRLGGLTPFNEQKELFDLNKKIVGHIDGMVTIGGKDFLIEVKGLKHESADLVLTCGLKKAIPGYYDQMTYYMHCLGVEAGYIIILDKDTSMWYTEKIMLDKERVKFLRRKALTLSGLKMLEEVPEQFVHRDCRFCPLIEMCADLEGKDKFIQNFIDSERRSINEQSTL